MKTPKHIIITLLLLIFNSIIFAQTRNNNLENKYNNYSISLKQNYVLGIGNNPGYSLPAAERQNKKSTIKWADATIFLGHYIGVLATEFYILSEKQQATDKTIEELYYALSTLYRLDYKAETYYYQEDSSAGTALLNGFFVRDDISNISKQEYTKLNSQSQLLEVKNFESDFTDFENGKTYSLNNEMSKDQVIFLLMGLKLVEKYIPENIAYKKGDSIMSINYSPNITSIKSAANHISKLILEYISSNKNILGWYIINPTTQTKVKRGFNAFHFQAKAYSKIYKGYTDGSNIYGRCNRLFAGIENGILRISLNPIIKNGQGHMSLTLAAISNQFGRKTQDKLFKYGFKQYKNGGNYEWEPLLNAVLFSIKTDSLDNKEEWYKNFLDQAPTIGPYNRKTEDLTYQNWSVSRRTTQPESRGSNYKGHEADFNGLDYMLIYNLYRIYYKQ